MKVNWSLVTWGIGILVVVGIAYGDSRARINLLERAQVDLDAKYSAILSKQDRLLERLTAIEVKLDERTTNHGGFK